MTNGVAAPNVPPGTEAVHKGERMIRAAILDDYQNVAMSLANWSPIAKDVEIKVFNEPFANQAEAVKALQGFAVVVGMRERTPFPRAVIEALPDLKLLITTGAKNNSFDVNAATERGVTVCGTGGFGSPTVGITFGLMLELTRRIGFESARMKRGLPARTPQSVRFTVVACTATRTSPGPTSGADTSVRCTISGGPYVVRTAALMTLTLTADQDRIEDWAERPDRLPAAHRQATSLTQLVGHARFPSLNT